MHNHHTYSYTLLQVMMKVNNLMAPKIAEAQQSSAQQPVQQ